jgi:hypothetical protein
MKRHALLFGCFFLFLILSVSLSAQVRFGIKAGTSIPNLHSDGTNEISADYKSKLAENFGVIADIGISEKLSLKTGLDYSEQGGIRNGQQPVTKLPAQFAQMLPDGTYLYADFNNEASLHYLEVPLMGKLQFGEKLKYYINAGPYLGFLMKAEQKTDGNSAFYLDKTGTMPLTVQGQPVPSQSFDANTDIEDDIKPTNFGLTGGIGFDYGLSNKNSLVLDARVAYGLHSIQEDTSANGNSRTGGVFLTLGYMFSL